jgi:hypothetical protein
MPLKSPELTKFTTASHYNMNVDYIDTFLGVGFIRLYLCRGEFDDTGDTDDYYLTTNNSISSARNNDSTPQTGWRTEVAGADIDFDIKVNKPFSVATVKAIMNATVHVDTNQTYQGTWILKHVDAAAAETTIGTITDSSIGGSAGSEMFITNARFLCAETQFKKGDTLRLTFTHSGTPSDTQLYHDPSGFYATSEDYSYGGNSFLLLPVEVDF